MKISIKRQTARATTWHEGANCVNILLGNFQMGLQVTEWGERKEIEPRITFTIKNKDYTYTVAELEAALKHKPE